MQIKPSILNYQTGNLFVQDVQVLSVLEERMSPLLFSITYLYRCIFVIILRWNSLLFQIGKRGNPGYL